jgi:uncharacterized protein YuzE
MKIKCSSDVDALYVTLADTQVAESDEVMDGVVIDYDKNRNVVGVELLNVSRNEGFEKIIKQYVEKVKAA